MTFDDDDSRIYSTTSGFSSGGSSTSVLSCCNNNEECKFNNSVKRYYSTMYQKAPSKLRRHISGDSSSKNDEDTLTLTSSNSCGTNCSFCCSKSSVKSHKKKSLGSNFPEFNNNNTIVKSSICQDQRPFGRKVLLERM